MYIRDEKTGVMRFHRAPRPTTAEVEALVIEIAEASEAFLATKGFEEGDEGDPPDEDDALALFQKASLHRTTATGPRAGKALRRQQVFGGKAFALPQRCGGYDGYNLHAGVEVAYVEGLSVGTGGRCSGSCAGRFPTHEGSILGHDFGTHQAMASASRYSIAGLVDGWATQRAVCYPDDS